DPERDRDQDRARQRPERRQLGIARAEGHETAVHAAARRADRPRQADQVLPATWADSPTPAESCCSRRSAAVSATRTGSISSRGSVLATTCGRSSVSRAKKTTSEPLACLISCASVSPTSYAATSTP